MNTILKERSRSKSQTDEKDSKIIVKKEEPVNDKKAKGKKSIVTKKNDEDEKSSQSSEESLADNDIDINQENEVDSRKEFTTATRRKRIENVFSYDVDKKEITNEIEKIIRKIEKKKNLGNITNETQKHLGKKVKREPSTKSATVAKSTAASFNYKLQYNKNVKTTTWINLQELSTRPVIFNTDILIALVEIASNSSYYSITFSNNSKMFWEDVVEYKVLSKIFQDYKPETLRKYWMSLSAFDPQNICDLVNHHKTFLDSLKIKLRTIITTVSKFLTHTISDFQQYINDISIDIKKQEIFEHEYQNPETGEVMKVKNVRILTRQRRKYEPGYKRKFFGKNIDTNGLEEIYGESKNKTKYQKIMATLTEEDTNKIKYLHQVTEETKTKLLTINEDDKFMFRVLDHVTEELSKEFPQFTSAYILDTLIANTMNIGRTYLSLSDINERKKWLFTSGDDEIILKMKGCKEYDNLVSLKGKEAVDERESFLKS